MANKKENDSTVTSVKVTTEPDDSQEKPAKKQKRQLKAAPVTLREQSEQAQAKSAKPKTRSRIGRIISAPFRFIGRLFRPLGKFKFFRVIGYIFAPPYIRSAFKELRLVTWPNAKQTRQLTFAVIIFSLVFGVLAAIVDFGLDRLFRSVILKQ